jgi:hypothetical protein
MPAIPALLSKHRLYFHLCVGKWNTGSSYLLGLYCVVLSALRIAHGRSHIRQAKQISVDPLLIEPILTRMQRFRRPS